MSTFWFDNISIQKKILIAFTLPALLFIAVSGLVYQNTQSMSKDNDWVTHTHQAIARTHELLTFTVDMETGLRGYLITGDEVFLEPYNKAFFEWSSKINTLSQQVMDNPPQVERLNRIDQLHEQWLNTVAQQQINKRQLVNQGIIPLNKVIESTQGADGKQIIDAIRVEINNFIQIEQSLIETRIADAKASASNTTYTLLFGTLLSALVVLLISMWISGRLKQQFNVLLDATNEVSSGNLVQGLNILKSPNRIAGFDEIGCVTTGFISMVDALINHNNNAVEYNNKLKEAVSKAEAATRAKSNFLSTMSHEIRTPMNGVLGVSQMILAETKEEETKQNANIILDSGKHLVTVLNDILDLSKIEGHKLSLEKIPFYLTDIISPIFGTIKPLAEEKGIELIIDNKVASNVEFTGDVSRLRQIIYNLIGNAIKFTEKGSISLTTFANQADKMLSITIADTGIGIPQDKQSTIFNAFEQADTSTTRKFGGTGLGLTIVKKLVELMGGEIKVSSVEGAGTKFIILLPLPWAEKRLARKEENKGVQTSFTEITAELNILIVEDNRVNAMVAKSFCTKQGFNVDTAANGLIATQMVQDKKFDLIIMDNHMPEMNGIEATRFIRQELGMDTLLFAYTADVFQEAHDGFIEAGADHILTKPMQKDSFKQALSLFSSRLMKQDHSNVTVLYREATDKLQLTEEELTNSPHFNTLYDNQYELVKNLESIIVVFNQAIDVLLDSYVEKDCPTMIVSVKILQSTAETWGIDGLVSLLHEIETALEHDKYPEIDKLQMVINRLQVNIHQAQRILKLNTDDVKNTESVH
ncbi:CHASE3 domain-containing protein [Moritella marina]|uniref:CHASE3 domain-containing protein n=1 Tax=Moritella marina TaxID=90736 RepID=UPI003704A653